MLPFEQMFVNMIFKHLFETCNSTPCPVSEIHDPGKLMRDIPPQTKQGGTVSERFISQTKKPSIPPKAKIEGP